MHSAALWSGTPAESSIAKPQCTDRVRDVSLHAQRLQRASRSREKASINPVFGGCLERETLVSRLCHMHETRWAAFQ
jgi:hypothetical protein